MARQGSITIWQFTALVFLCTIGDSILILPTNLARVAKQDAWIAAILSICAFGLLLSVYGLHVWRSAAARQHSNTCKHSGQSRQNAEQLAGNRQGSVHVLFDVWSYFTRGGIIITSPYLHNEIPKDELDGNAALEIAIEQAEEEECGRHKNSVNNNTITLSSSTAPRYFGAEKGGQSDREQGNGSFIDRALSRRMENGMDKR